MPRKETGHCVLRSVKSLPRVSPPWGGFLLKFLFLFFTLESLESLNLQCLSRCFELTRYTAGFLLKLPQVATTCHNMPQPRNLRNFRQVPLLSDLMVGTCEVWSGSGVSSRLRHRTLRCSCTANYGGSEFGEVGGWAAELEPDSWNQSRRQRFGDWRSVVGSWKKGRHTTDCISLHGATDTEQFADANWQNRFWDIVIILILTDFERFDIFWQQIWQACLVISHGAAPDSRRLQVYRVYCTGWTALDWPIFVSIFVGLRRWSWTSWLDQLLLWCSSLQFNDNDIMTLNEVHVTLCSVRIVWT